MNPFDGLLHSFGLYIRIVFQVGFFVGAGLALVCHFVRARREARAAQNRWEERKGRDGHYRRAA